MKKLVPESLNEVNFERGRDPRGPLKIGVVDTFLNFLNDLANGETDGEDHPNVKHLAGGDIEMNGEALEKIDIVGNLCKEGKMLSDGDMVSDETKGVGQIITIPSFMEYRIFQTEAGWIMELTLTDMGQLVVYSCLTEEYDKINDFIDKRRHPDGYQGWNVL